ncbi:hypothetical protein C8J56DRAFT_1166214 [Mycena floridula]|nr:hypothetical protein C8J56DRAFT_1166214 [Mycena floridula]
MPFPPIITAIHGADNSLADISHEASISRDTLGTVSTVTEACFVEGSSSVTLVGREEREDVRKIVRSRDDEKGHKKHERNEQAGGRMIQTQDQKEREKGRDDGGGELTRMIGSEDWTLVLEVCERAIVNDSNVKEAVRAIRREFKYGEPFAQLSAARLWAIMLRNSTETFISQSTSRKFLDTVEDLLMSPRTSPVVRERVMDVVSAAAYASHNKKAIGFRGLWRNVKPPGKPDEGVPFDTSDAMFNPPIPSSKLAD